MMPTNPKILIVDDNPAALYATARILRSAGFEVQQATTGQAALSAASDADLVVLDINLPDIDGFEVCRQLRADTRTAKLPILHLSATFIQSEDFEIGLAAGADSYLTRPVEPPVLIATIRTLLFTRQAEISRRDLDAKLRTMFNLSPVAIAILDGDLHYESVNPAYCALTGYGADDLVRRVDGTNGHPPTDPLLSSVSRQIREYGSRSGNVVIKRPDHSDAEVSWDVTKEDVSGVTILLARDVSAQRLAERERESLLASERAARAEAERSNRLKEEFLATLSHELRNPLNAILGWATVLTTVKNLPATVSSGVQAIQRNAQVQAQMIGDLLEYAGISFGKIRLQPQLLNPYLCVQGAIDILSSTAQQKGVTLQAELAWDGAHISGDTIRIQQIVLNLLGNAIKFSEVDGTVRISARSSGQAFHLVVSDEGIGISPVFLPHIFERFSQQDATTTRSHGGLGLGLAIVKHLVELHGGTIEAASAGTSLGATFSVSFPICPGAPATTLERRRDTATTSIADLVVLVVEDDVDSRELIVRIFSDAGARVIEASSAVAALALLETDDINLLISDIGMPGKDGYQLVRDIRAQGYDAKRLPAIAVTAFARPKDRHDAIEAGFQHHLVKPIDPRALLRIAADSTRHGMWTHE